MSESNSREGARLAIVDAAASLLKEHGPAAVTTRGVAEAAGVQAPTIYRLFGDKDGLLDSIAEHVFATHVSAKEASAQAEIAGGGDAVDDLRAGWRSQIEFGLANPTLFTLMSDPIRGRSSPAARAGAAVLAERVRRIARAGRLAVSEQRAVDLVHAAGTGAVLALLAAPSGGSDTALADDLFDAVLGRILVEAPESERNGPVAATVAFRAVVDDLESLTDAERTLLVEWLDRVVGY
ncbi:TetR/AcrR family transcriptional regulator [Rhodococcoides kyotonense]|uniref:DNA-binding transcriptional regulator, AcrR family n=1 Tax=Rhodococcoides kyotonense TaxID=398843 RepID=A0A239J6B7_9NOCA|nr:TetR/AcrR family transcriptional regulator [Rhodococcus kyotonensis]SNT00184.1 DNA-binding transcriptional regulator, AcrR family [Rhodococcus kyotonensis]